MEKTWRGTAYTCVTLLIATIMTCLNQPARRTFQSVFFKAFAIPECR